MAKPTLTAVRRLRKIIGYLKTTGDLGVKLSYPMDGSGHWVQGADKKYMVESFCGADSSSKKIIDAARREPCTW